MFVWAAIFAVLVIPNSAPAQERTGQEVKTVMNAAEPRDGVLTPKFVELWSVGGENDPQGELINRPLEVRVGTDGSVYVLDWGDTCVRVFDSKGKFVRQIGRPGQGPGEINLPCWIDLAPNEELFVLDGMNMRISRFAKDGTFVKSFRLEKLASLLRTDGLGRVYRGEESTEEWAGLSSEFKEVVRSITIVRTDADGGNAKRFGPLVGQKMMRKGDGKGGSIVTMAREAATTGWGVDRNGRLYAGYNEKYELGVWDPEGTLLFRFGRKFEPVKNPLSKPSAGRTLAARTQPGNLPAFNPDFFFDDDGNLWLPLYRAGDKDPFLYDVFSPDGIYLKQIAAPFRIYQVRGGKAYAIVESEEGFRVLKCFRLELPAAKAGRSPEGR